MRHFLTLSITLYFVAASLAGTCPRYPLIRDFNFEKYLGMWYQQDKKQAGWEVPGRCWKSLYHKDPKTGQFKMRMIFENTITGREGKYDSELSLLGPRLPSVIKYKIPLTFLEDKFQVLATDYETFSVEYKCDPNGILEKQESVFLLTRSQNPDPIILQKAYAIMHRYGIDIRKLERVDQTCGRVQVIPLVPTPPVSEDYDFYSSPSQDINDNRASLISEAESERYDYYDAPPIITAAPRVVIKERRPPVFRRRTPPFLRHPFPTLERRNALKHISFRPVKKTSTNLKHPFLSVKKTTTPLKYPFPSAKKTTTNLKRLFLPIKKTTTPLKHPILSPSQVKLGASLASHMKRFLTQGPSVRETVETIL